MAYKVSGSLQEPMTITILNSDGIAQATESFEVGPWEFGDLVCASGTIVGFTPEDWWMAFGNVNFIEYDNRPSVPWTETFLPEPSITRWRYSTGTNKPFIYNNKLRLVADSTTYSPGINSSYLINGDFDMEIEYSLAQQGNSTWGFNFSLFFPAINTDTEYMVRMRRDYDTSARYLFDGFNNGSYFSNTASATGNTSGKLRLTRVNSVFTGYYWNGSSWTQVGTVNLGSSTGYRPVSIYIVTERGASTNLIVDVTNFKVNSGTIQYRFIDFSYKQCNNLQIQANNSIFTQEWDYPMPYYFSGKLRFNVDYSKKLGTHSHVQVSAMLKEYLVGDFDVSVDLNVLQGPTANTWQHKLSVFTNDGNTITIGRWYSGSAHIYLTETVVNDVYNGYSVATTEIQPSFRIRRVGSNIYTYYKAQSSSTWTLHRSVASFTTADLFLSLSGILSEDAIYGITIGDFSNLIINNPNGVNTKLLVVPNPYR